MSQVFFLNCGRPPFILPYFWTLNNYYSRQFQLSWTHAPGKPNHRQSSADASSDTSNSHQTLLMLASTSCQRYGAINPAAASGPPRCCRVPSTRLQHFPMLKPPLIPISGFLRPPLSATARSYFMDVNYRGHAQNVCLKRGINRMLMIKTWST